MTNSAASWMVSPTPFNRTSANQSTTLNYDLAKLRRQVALRARGPMPDVRLSEEVATQNPFAVAPTAEGKAVAELLARSVHISIVSAGVCEASRIPGANN